MDLHYLLSPIFVWIYTICCHRILDNLHYFDWFLDGFTLAVFTVFWNYLHWLVSLFLGWIYTSCFHCFLDGFTLNGFSFLDIFTLNGFTLFGWIYTTCCHRFFGWIYTSYFDWFLDRFTLFWLIFGRIYTFLTVFWRELHYFHCFLVDLLSLTDFWMDLH